MVGVGGLGCPASLGLALAGARHLTLVDFDRVELSNLHRQPWFTEADVGEPKVEVAARRLRAAFPGLGIDAQQRRLEPREAAECFAGHQVAIDGVDDGAFKFALSRASREASVPLVHGGVIRLEGLAFRIEVNGPCLECLFEGPPPNAPTCAQAGVLGTVAGVVGALQAELALRSEPTPGEARLLRVDGRSGAVREVSLRRAVDCPVCR